MDYDIISGTEGAYWTSNSTVDNDKDFVATINDTQRLLQQLITKLEQLKNLERDRPTENSN
jgi:hypothetical protein